MVERRSNLSVTVLEGRLMVAGGFRKKPQEEKVDVCGEMEVFCPVDNRCCTALWSLTSSVARWSRGPALQEARSALGAVTLARGSLL